MQPLNPTAQQHHPHLQHLHHPPQQLQHHQQWQMHRAPAQPPPLPILCAHNRYGATPLHIAALLGSAPLTRVLLAGPSSLAPLPAQPDCLRTFAVFQGTSNGVQRFSNRKTRVNRRSNLPYNGTIWRCDRLLLKNWRPPFEVPWKHAKTVFSVIEVTSALDISKMFWLR